MLTIMRKTLHKLALKTEERRPEDLVVDGRIILK
jgi:hypothetical protein